MNILKEIDTNFEQLELDINLLRQMAIKPLIEQLIQCFEAQGYALSDTAKMLAWVISDRYEPIPHWHDCIFHIERAAQAAYFAEKSDAAKGQSEVDKSSKPDESTHVQQEGEWKFNIGDLAFATGEATENCEAWREDVIIVGRIWADEKSSSYFDGREERIEHGRNYFCRINDKDAYLTFHHEDVLTLVASVEDKRHAV